MSEPIQIQHLNHPGRIGPTGAAGAFPSRDAQAPAKSFSDVLVDSLDEVKRLQDEAAQGVSNLLTGESNNPDEVFSAIRKADVAFSLLMELRNKLTDAYQELKQMSV